jgi:hypothetical protein
VVPPEYVLAPAKVNVPDPDLVRAPVSETTPLNVWFEPEPIARVPFTERFLMDTFVNDAFVKDALTPDTFAIYEFVT